MNYGGGRKLVLRAATHAAAQAIVAESLGVRIVEVTVKGWPVEARIVFAKPAGEHHRVIELAGTVAESVLLGDGSIVGGDDVEAVAGVVRDESYAIRRIAAKLYSTRKMTRQELSDSCDFAAIRRRIARHFELAEVT